MGDSECVDDLDGDDFEVVDECTGEDDDVVEYDAQDSGQLEGDENYGEEEVTEIIHQDNPETKKNQNNQIDKDANNDNNPDVIAIESNKSEPKKVEKQVATTVNTDAKKTNNGIDFATDVSFDKSNDAENVQNAEENELERTSSNLLSQDSAEHTDTNESNAELSEVVIVGEDKDKAEVTPSPPWYEDKLTGKIVTAKERLTKLSRVLKRSYSCYQECLDRVEAAVGTPVCKLFPPRKCPLNEPYINRWRFVCTKKPVEEPAIAKMEEDNVDMTVDKKVETVWRLQLSEELTRNANKDYETIPTFVMRVVKIFEDFINTNDQSDLPEPPVKEDKEPEKHDDVADDVIEITEREDDKDLLESMEPEHWLWLLVRSNSKNELMLFATGKCITNSSMENMKHFFETGRGSDCDVKSLYCKSITKVDNITTSNTTFLLGTEALDETIGGLKIQLAPKTNFWLSTVGAEQLANEVELMVVPNPNTVVLDVGCGLGLIGLMMASKCEKVIGLDSPSEVEEAEMTCEINKIENASFVMGNPNEVMSSLAHSLSSKRTSVIINANTEMGRNIDVMAGLRKITSLRRIVMVTTLTKQSVHPILKLIQPTDEVLGDPFVPIRAIVVDTLPIGPQFEVVIRFDRRPMHRIFNMHLSNPKKVKSVQGTPVPSAASAASKGKPPGRKFPPSRRFGPGKNNRRDQNKNPSPIKTNTPQGKGIFPILKATPEQAAVAGPVKLVKNPFYDQPGKWTTKRTRKPESPVRRNDRRNRKFDSPALKDTPKRNRDWELGNFVPAKDKKSRTDNDDDLRLRLSNNRIDPPDLIHQMEKQQKLLEVAKQKLSGNRATVDSTTAKQLQNMLKMAIENTSQVQSHLRRSVWDRIAPHDNYKQQEFDNSPVFKGHLVKELGQEDIIITTPNNEFVPTKSEPRSNYALVAPVEPNQLAPKEKWVVLPSAHVENYRQTQRERPQDESRKRDFGDSRNNRWSGSSRRSKPSPPRHYDELSTRRMSSPKRSLSPGRGNYQSNRSYDDSISQRRLSSPRRASPHRQRSPLRRAPSPRRLSSPRRQSSPVRMGDDWDIPTRGAVEQHPNWQRTIDRPIMDRPIIDRPIMDRPIIDRPVMDRSAMDRSTIRPDPPPLMSQPRSLDSSWNMGNTSGDAWNSNRNQPISENRFANQNNDWNIRGKETFNQIPPSRNDSWLDGNKQRWEQPQPNKSMWIQGADKDKEDWNDLPEDARDPWGDDGGTSNDRWKFEQLQQVSGNNWNRNETVDWSGNKDRSNKPELMSLMSAKPNWPGSMGNNSSMNNRWSGPGDINPMSQQSPAGNWQQGSNANPWRGNPAPQNASTPFTRLRYFNCNLK